MMETARVCWATLAGAFFWGAQVAAAGTSPGATVHAEQALLNAGASPAFQQFARRCASPAGPARLAQPGRAEPRWTVLTLKRKHLVVVSNLGPSDWRATLEPGLRKRGVLVKDVVGMVVLRSRLAGTAESAIGRDVPVPVYFGEQRNANADVSGQAVSNVAVDVAPFKLRMLTVGTGESRPLALAAALGPQRVSMVTDVQPNDGVELVEALHRLAREMQASDLASLSEMPSVQGGANAVQRVLAVARECALIPLAVPGQSGPQPWRHVELKVIAGSTADDAIASVRDGRDPVTGGIVNFSRGPHRACFASPGSDGIARCRMVDPHPHLPGERSAHGDEHDQSLTATFGGVVGASFVLTPAVSTR